MSELRALTGVRGIAAWFVVAYHIRLSVAGLPTALREIFAKGYLAVDFFFLLSGFVIWLTWHERLRGTGAAGVARFLQKRIARIWPLHLATLGAAVALALLLVARGHPDPHFLFDELPLHVLLLQNWGFTPYLAWNDPAWSISAELGAYLLLPVLVTAVDWRRVPGVLLVAIAAMLLAILPAVIPGGLLGADIARYGLLRCLVEFATGTIVCALWLRWRDRRTAPYVNAVAAALVACWAMGLPETAVVPALFACLLLLLALTAGRAGNPLEGRAVHYLGEISYATYLGHFILWKAFKLAFVADPTAVAWPAILAYLALVLATSALLYRFVERPAQGWINRLGRTPRRVPARAW